MYVCSEKIEVLSIIELEREKVERARESAEKR